MARSVIPAPARLGRWVNILPLGIVFDLLATRLEGVPATAKGLKSLAVRVARLGVAGEAVQRVSVVSELRSTVGANRRPEQGLGRSRRDGRLGGGRGHWRPSRGACPAAHGGAAGVLLKQVHGPARAVSKNRTERGVG